MKPVERLLGEYAADHQHPFNRRIHTLCVPAIAVSLLGLLASLPVPGSLRAMAPAANWALFLLAGALAWYLWLSPRLAAGMAIAAALAMLLVAALSRLPGPLWLSSGVLFLLAWAGQFAGHAAEDRRPSFLRDLRFLLIGPLWLLAELYRRLHLRV